MSKIIAYACSGKPNHLWSAAQFNNALEKNRKDCDIPLVSLAEFEALETATRECLGWIRHWQADVAGNLKPTPDSLAMMEAKLVAILQPVEAPEAAE